MYHSYRPLLIKILLIVIVGVQSFSCKTGQDNDTKEAGKKKTAFTLATKYLDFLEYII